MAEVANIPASALEKTALTREKSSLSGPLTKADDSKVDTGIEKGIVTIPKKPFGMRLKETFIAEDARDVGDYILWDILVPTIKRTIRDIIVGSADRIFLGTSTTPNNLYKDRNVTYVKSQTNYASITRNKVEAKSLPVANPRPSQANYEILNLVFDDYGQLSQAFSEAVDYLDTYGELSINNYAAILAQHFKNVPSTNFVSQNLGWKSLRNATIESAAGGGYFVKLPTPIAL